MLPGEILSMVAYSPQFANEQTQAATGFMVGYLRGVRDYYEAFHVQHNRQAAIDILVQRTFVTDPHVWETAPPTTTDLNGDVDLEILRRSVAFYVQQGFMSGPGPDVTTLVDSRFTLAAAQQLGRR